MLLSAVILCLYFQIREDIQKKTLERVKMVRKIIEFSSDDVKLISEH